MTDITTRLNTSVARDTATTDRDLSKLSGEALANDLGGQGVYGTPAASPATLPTMVQGVTAQDDHGDAFGGITTLEFENSTVTNPSTALAHIADRYPRFMTVAISSMYDSNPASGDIGNLTNSMTRVRTHGYTQARIVASSDATGAATLTATYYNVAGASWDNLGTGAVAVALDPGSNHPVYSGWIALAANAINGDIDLRVYPSGYSGTGDDVDPLNIQIQFLSGPILGGTGGGGSAAPVESADGAPVGP